MTKLLVAETFFSQQSEGISTGVPAFFLRLAKCNLVCGGVNGSLVKSGKATWYCDTIPVWSKGTERTFDEIYDEMVKFGIIDWINTGRCHLVISGGEPTMEMHQNNIIEFIKYLKSKGATSPYIEIETNGTNIIKDELFNLLTQINCSPKLSNSGMTYNVRIKPDVIKQISTHSNFQFKFVVNTEDNVKECIDTIITPFNISWKNIVLMPGVDSIDNLSENTRTVFELGKKYGYRAITRSHVLAWNKLTGV